MKRYVFDSYAILAFLEDERAAGEVEKILREIENGRAKGLLSIINWGEIYYTTMREQGRDIAESVIDLLDTYPLKLIESDRSLTLAAARFKGKYRIAYADCFAAALAVQSSAILLTGDPEFKVFENEIKIDWLP
ncbi:MAG: type II toxin-antitoxin system VapC family toxin [Thermodesulfobacteriota bacterium]|jgi:ribonuclease VapC